MNGHIGSLQVSAPSITIRGGGMLVPAGAVLTNQGSGLLLVSAQATDAAGQVSECLEITLPAASSYTLPAPPGGQQWFVMVTTPRQVARAMEDAGLAGLLVLGFAGYGAVRAWQDWRRRRY